MQHTQLRGELCSAHIRCRSFRSHKIKEASRHNSARAYVYLKISPRTANAKQRRLQATFVDEAPPWTLDQIAGLAFGAFLILCIVLARQVDVIIARSQRKELGLCVECGGLFDPADCPEWRCPLKSEE